MSPTSPRQLGISRTIIILVLWYLGLAGAVSASAQDLRVPADGRLRDLASLYTADSVATISKICAERFPETREVWNQAWNDFRIRNRESLVELDRLQKDINVALRAKPPVAVDLDTLASILLARGEILNFLLHMLAPMNDAEGRKYCDETRVDFANSPIGTNVMRQARIAAAAAVENLSRR